jgi:hypothetical protein
LSPKTSLTRCRLHQHSFFVAAMVDGQPVFTLVEKIIGLSGLMQE